MRKLGVEFRVYDNKIALFDECNNKVEVSFESEAAKNKESMENNFKKSLSKTNDTPYLVKNVKFECEIMPFLAVSEINKLRADLLNKLSEKILSRYKVKKQKPVDIAKFPQDRGDYRLNIHNKKAEEYCEFCDCRVDEKSFEHTENYKNKELMRTRHCLRRACLSCGDKRKLFLEDEKGVKYPLVFDCKNCEMAILAP